MKCMEPIQGLSKARRKLWGNPQNVISWAFMKQLREHNETRKVYACNPYIEVYQFRDNLYGLFNQNCDGAGDVWQWLIVGPEKCLLVDTAFGLGDMKALVDEISGGKEIIVVNTHDHFDHAFGNCRFGRAYCHESLVPLLEAQNEHMWDYLWDKKTGETIWLDFDKKDLPKFKPYEIIGVPDGYTWDLGKGYLVELINSNGHGGPGASMYLDHSNKIFSRATTSVPIFPAAETYPIPSKNVPCTNTGNASAGWSAGSTRSTPSSPCISSATWKAECWRTCWSA